MNAQYKRILIALVIGACFYFVASIVLSSQHSILIAIIACMVALRTNEGLPLGVTSLLPILIFPSVGILDAGEVTANYSKTIIFLFLGGFLLAIATEKIGLHKFLANKIFSVFPKTPRGIIFALACTGAILSSVLSNTTAALLLIPIALFMSDEKKFQTRLVLAVAYGCSIGGIITPIGTPPNLILLGFLEQQAIQAPSFLNWIAMMIPVASIMLVVMSYILSVGVNKLQLHDKKNRERSHISPKQKRLLLTLCALVLILFLNSPIGSYPGLGLNEKLVLLGFGLLMFVPGFGGSLTRQDSKKIPFDIFFLFGAGFSIANAFVSSGLADTLASMMVSLSSLPLILLVAIIGFSITFTTEVTSNTALISIALPIIYALGSASGLPTQILLMVATICASYAFMLPIATPPNAIAMSSKVVSIKQMATYGLVFNIVGIILVVASSYLVRPFFIG